MAEEMTENTILEQYKMLRKEIDDKIKITNDITLEMIGSFLVLAGLGFQKELKEVFPLCSLLCLFMYLRIHYYHQAISRISAYMIVFLEKGNSIKWETRNHIIFKEGFREKISENPIPSFGWLGFIESLTFQIISFSLWIIVLFKNQNFSICDICDNWFSVTTFELFSLVVILFITYRLARRDSKYHTGQKGDWIQYWEDYMTKKKDINEDANLNKLVWNETPDISDSDKKEELKI